MAAHPIVVMDEELLERLPESFKSDPRYQKGASLELVPVKQSSKITPEQATANWRGLQGILAMDGQTFSATDLKRQEREWELTHDERKFGVDRPRW